MPARILDLPRFRSALLHWYDRNRRDLPWRGTRDPYRVWLAEIMLQQTRVAAVEERYQQFLERFPSLEKLAAARLASVLAEWSGLGYYRRARNLHAAARFVARELAGKLPGSAEQLCRLPGVGRYTAAAVASIAFDQPVAVVDGNVERVLARLCAWPRISGARLWALAQELLASARPGDFNQAVMELGATVCVPGEPKCRECPVRSFCRTRGQLKPAKRKTRQIKRVVAYALACRPDAVLLVRRKASESLMPGMWELPPVSWCDSDQPLFSLRHSITVTDYTVRVVYRSRISAGTWVRSSRLPRLPLTGLTKKILYRAGIIKGTRARKRGRE
jgi:A/G-specific adenine glycosylase